MTASSCEIERLLSTLRRDDLPVPRSEKISLVNDLRKLEAALVRTALSVGLKDSDPNFRCEIAWVFLAFDFNGAIGQVAGVLLDDMDDGVRAYLGEILGASKRVETIPLLIEMLQRDEDGTNRLIAARSLGYIGDPAALPALRTAMQNDDGVDYEGRPVKEIAAEAIRRITQEKAAASVA